MPPLRETDLPPVHKHFVDREEPQRTFEQAAFAIPDDRAILRVFYGIGGQGKTELCRELMRKTNGTVDPSYRFLRRAMLDLHRKAKTDPDLLLVWIRNEFAKVGLFMPCFDLALALMWEGSRGEQPFPTLVNPWLGRLTSKTKSAVDEGSDKACDWLQGESATELLGEVINQIPGVGFVLRRLGHWVIDRSKKAFLERTRAHLQRLYYEGELLSSHKIAEILPWMLAQDLNYHLSEHPNERFVLFIDEYEGVFDHWGSSARWIENPFDQHLRSFIRETNGLLAVFFSRERLTWAEDRVWRADLADHQHLLGGLRDEDADEFLRLIPINDPIIRAAIIGGAREKSTSVALVYPWMLDMQVDHWRELTAKGNVSPDQFNFSAVTFEDHCRTMIQRVLRHYGTSLQATIERLSVAERFDKAAFEHIVREFGTGVPFDSFERIISLSFVTARDDGFYSFPDIISQVIRGMLSENRRSESVASLFKHFWERAKVGSHRELSQSKIIALFEASRLRQQMSTSA